MAAEHGALLHRVALLDHITGELREHVTQIMAAQQQLSTDMNNRFNEYAAMLVKMGDQTETFGDKLSRWQTTANGLADRVEANETGLQESTAMLTNQQNTLQQVVQTAQHEFASLKESVHNLHGAQTTPSVPCRNKSRACKR